MFNIGAAAIRGGLAEVVLVVAGDSLLSGLTPELALRSLTESRDQQYEMPFGIPVANTFAMTAHRHMKEFGTTAEQLAAVAVIQRRHASRTPGAQQTTPIGVDDVLNSGHGDDALPQARLLADIGRRRGVRPDLGRHAPMRSESKSRSIFSAAASVCPRAYFPDAVADIGRRGQVEPKGLQDGRLWPEGYRVAGVYDCFTGTVIMMLEDLRFLPQGRRRPFRCHGHMTYGGQIPSNTHGGLLSFAHSGLPDRCFISTK